MKYAITKICLISIFMTSIFLVECTRNPFGNDYIVAKNRKITGNIRLNDNSSPDGVYVLLEGLNLGTFTNRNGDYEFEIPHPKQQSGNGLSGTYKLYFYVANYNIQTAEIVIQNGELVYLPVDLDQDGKIRHTTLLKKILRINTDVEPASVPEDYAGAIEITLSLQATDDSVTVTFPDKSQGPLSIVFIKDINESSNFLAIKDLNGSAFAASMVAETVTVKVHAPWITAFKLEGNNLPRGDYKIIPYFLISNENLPAELLNSLGVNVNQPVSDFMNIPIKRYGGDLNITSKND